MLTVSCARQSKRGFAKQPETRNASLIKEPATLHCHAVPRDCVATSTNPIKIVSHGLSRALFPR